MLASASEYNNIYITPQLKAILAKNIAVESMTLLDENLLIQNLQRHQNALTGNKQLTLITALPLDLTVRQVDTAEALQDKSKITHLACQGHAYPLPDKAFFLNTGRENPLSLNSEEDSAAKLSPTNLGWHLCLTFGQNRENSPQVFVNARPARERQKLYIGDQISLGQDKPTFLLLKLEEALH